MVEDFLHRSRMPPTRFGKEAINDLSFVAELRRGRVVKLDTLERVRRYIEAWDRERAKVPGQTKPRRRAAKQSGDDVAQQGRG